MVIQDHVIFENTCAQTIAVTKDMADAEVSMIIQPSDTSISPVASLSKMIDITRPRPSHGLYSIAFLITLVGSAHAGNLL